MENQVRRSSLFGRFDCSVIPNGVDLDQFFPLDSAVARSALGIPAGRKVLAFVADKVKNVRKGFSLLLDAVKSLAKQHDLHLLAVGQSSPLPLELPATLLGPIQAVAFLRQVYSAADVFVIPSLEDNQPNTVLEAMACGTAVAGFGVGGIPEMVQTGETGVLAKNREVNELARAIEYLLMHEPERRRMATAARQCVEQRFTRTGQVQKYSELYARLLARRPAEEKVREIPKMDRVAVPNGKVSAPIGSQRMASQSSD
jgi:glycosyltransferase involved in cell wall biosynthesis